MCFGPDLAVDAAKTAQEHGYDALWVAEANHDPFSSAVLAVEHSTRLHIGTSVAIAFARSPMTLALTADDLQRVSRGRFILGIGSQIRPHIERRYSMPWSRPAARMREYVQALHAIWACWHDGEPLDFRGEFYTHTLMPPFFNPGPNPHGSPPVLLAGAAN